MYEEVDISTLSQDQLRRVVTTHWVVGDRPDPTTTTTTTTGEVHASELRARFVANGYSQHINDPMECYAATPSSTSLKGLLLLGILQGHQTTCLDINTTFINTPLPPTEPPIYVQPPAEWYTAIALQHYGASKRRCTDYVRHQSCGDNILGLYYANKIYDNARQIDAFGLHLDWEYSST